MRSNQTQHTILVTKRTNAGVMPLFVRLGHRGLEKSQPAAKRTQGRSSTYIISKDILSISVSDPFLIDDIVSIEFTYEKPS